MSRRTLCRLSSIVALPFVLAAPTFVLGQGVVIEEKSGIQVDPNNPNTKALKRGSPSASKSGGQESKGIIINSNDPATKGLKRSTKEGGTAAGAVMSGPGDEGPAKGKPGSALKPTGQETIGRGVITMPDLGAGRGGPATGIPQVQSPGGPPGLRDPVPHLNPDPGAGRLKY